MYKILINYIKRTNIEPNQNSVSYQPGNTFIGGGIYKKEDVMYDTNDFIPSGVIKWFGQRLRSSILIMRF